MFYAKKILAGIAFFAIFSSCLTYQGQYDTSVPMAEQVTLVIQRPLDLVSVNGNDVDVGLIAWSPFGSSSIRLPVGEHTLGFAYRSIASDSQYRYTITGSNTVTYNFESGYTYYASSYTEVLGAKYSDVDTAFIANLSGGFKVAIQRKEKEQSGVYTAFENGYIAGISRGAINAVGLDIGAVPFGFIVDFGKLAFGIETNVGMNFGWKPNPLKDEFEKYDIYDDNIPMDLELSAGGLFCLYFNSNNGKAFGIGVGGGYTTSMFSMFGSGDYGIRYYDHNTYEYVETAPFPNGLWYIRGAIIPSRRTKFTIYFDYYLKDLLPEIPPNKSSPGTMDFQEYYKSIAKHPRNWNSWGIGLSGKFY